jgi:hypothetical protein
VQLSLPGADPEASVELAPADAAPEIEPATEDDEEPAADGAAPRTHGLVASGAQDDSH